jgi:hypothetical protein
MYTARIHFQEFVKERPVVDHGLTQFFRARFTSLASQRECASGSVILDDHRMINREIVRPLIEIFQGIAASRHHLRDELIGFAHRAGRVINEARLNATPFAGKCIGLFLRELAQIETADALSALLQNSISAWADRFHRAFVLRPKPSPQVHASAPAHVNPGRKPQQHDCDTNTDEHEGF